jgi:diguanylate cyclase (GGDEF)-like protein
MTLQENSPAILLWISAAIAAVTAWLTWRRRSVPGALALSGLMLAVVEWALTSGLEAASPTLGVKIFFAKAEYLGSSCAAPLFLIFALSYSHQQNWLKRQNLILLSSVPVIMILLAWTNEWHHLIWTSITPASTPGSTLYVYHHGVAFYLLIAYIYICNAAAVLVLYRSYLHSPKIYRRQVDVVIAGALIPWVGSLIYVLNLLPTPGLDITPIAFAITGLVLAGGILSHQLLGLAPIARDAIIDQLHEGILVLDDQNRVIDMNPAARHLFDLNEVPVGSDCSSVFQKWPQVVEALARRSEKPAEIQMSPSATKYIDIHIVPVRGRRQFVYGYLATIQDITERKVIEATLEAQTRELERQAITDDLTGLYNRRYTNEVLAREFQRSERHHSPLSLALFDVDNFKLINDQYGHACGDEALRVIARELRAGLRSTDIAARMGGDEFLIVFLETEMDRAWIGLERLRARLAVVELVLAADGCLQMTISGGLTSWFPGDTPDDALKRTDRLLYEAKNGGKDRILQSPR